MKPLISPSGFDDTANLAGGLGPLIWTLIVLAFAGIAGLVWLVGWSLGWW